MHIVTLNDAARRYAQYDTAFIADCLLSEAMILQPVVTNCLDSINPVVPRLGSTTGGEIKHHFSSHGTSLSTGTRQFVASKQKAKESPECEKRKKNKKGSRGDVQYRVGMCIPYFEREDSAIFTYFVFFFSVLSGDLPCTLPKVRPVQQVSFVFVTTCGAKAEQVVGCAVQPATNPDPSRPRPAHLHNA